TFDPVRAFDFEHGVDYGFPDSTPTPEYLEAFGRFFGDVAQYGFLNTGEWPDPLPARLTVSFTEFVNSNNYQPLYPGLFYSLGIIGGFVDFNNTPAIYVLANMPP